VLNKGDLKLHDADGLNVYPMKVSRGMYPGSEDLSSQYKHGHKLFFSSADGLHNIFICPFLVSFIN
jgi:hypothetical protein